MNTVGEKVLYDTVPVSFFDRRAKEGESSMKGALLLA